MKISNSKKELARIISENGGWPERALWAAQDNCIAFFLGGKPEYKSGDRCWYSNCLDGACVGTITRDEKVTNWHQTILSRDEYFHLYPAPDAEAEQKAEIRWVRGKDIYATPTAHDCMEMLKEKLGSTECGCDECSAFYSKPAAHAESTIEQLAADYRNTKDYAERTQQEADAAKADAEAKLAELVAAGEALGLTLSVTGAESKSELAIIDWRDLQVDDLIWYAGDDELSYGEYRVMGVENPDYEGYRTVLVSGYSGGHWIDTRAGWGFIRRPT